MKRICKECKSERPYVFLKSKKLSSNPKYKYKIFHDGNKNHRWKGWLCYFCGLQYNRKWHAEHNNE